MTNYIYNRVTGVSGAGNSDFIFCDGTTSTMDVDITAQLNASPYTNKIAQIIAYVDLDGTPVTATLLNNVVSINFGTAPSAGVHTMQLIVGV